MTTRATSVPRLLTHSDQSAGRCNYQIEVHQWTVCMCVWLGGGGGGRCMCVCVYNDHLTVHYCMCVVCVPRVGTVGGCMCMHYTYVCGVFSTCGYSGWVHVYALYICVWCVFHVWVQWVGACVCIIHMCVVCHCVCMLVI